MSNELLGLPPKKPNRVSDPAKRPEPRMPDAGYVEPWFVSPEKNPKSSQYSLKNTTKRLVSILFPLAGILLIGATVAGTILYVLGMYE